MIYSLVIVLGVLSSYTSTPEDFLQNLCDNTEGPEAVRFWQQSAWPEIDPILIHTDSLSELLDSMKDPNVDPGRRILRNIDENTGQYSVEYPESHWSWTEKDGKSSMATGRTVVVWSDGQFYWKELPVFSRTVISVGISDRIMTGLFFTVIILIFGTITLIWAKRKYTG